jgi:hypothetical protein
LAADLGEELGVTDWFYLSGIHLGIPLINFFVIRPERNTAKSVQQEGNKSLPILFRKLFRLFSDVCKLNHIGSRLPPSRTLRNLELGS